jgi:hypothetical protein
MHNKTRTARMQTRSAAQLIAIINRGSLSSTAASYWLKRLYSIDHWYGRVISIVPG